jgi:hypothetical protein
MTTAVLSPGTRTADATALPLCVDLDGTLVRSDTLLEGFCAFATDPRVFGALLRLRDGRAAFKQAVAAGVRLDPALLPYNETLLAYLRPQRAAGRALFLATAADQRVAQSIAAHLGIFDGVIASDGSSNLKGAAKARALTERFGERGFVYAGNARSDLAIWQQAAAVILVNAPDAVAGKVRGTLPIELTIADQPPLLPELIKAMRPHQWVKNVLAFVPILTAHALTETSAWFGGILMFLAFCFTASAIYLVNDLLDIAADRAHPRKRLRPFARGAVPLPVGAAAAVVLLVAGFALGLAGHVAWVVALYAVMSISYSFGAEAVAVGRCVHAGGSVHDPAVRRRRGDGTPVEPLAAGIFQFPVPQPGVAEAGRGDDERQQQRRVQGRSAGLQRGRHADPAAVRGGVGVRVQHRAGAVRAERGNGAELCLP